jgi:hypothetical protein
MPVPPVETIKWFALLFAALLLTSFGTTFPNRLNQQRSPRSHNGVRLFNECLARSQLAMFNYFLALGVTASLPNHPNVKLFLLPVAVLAAYFYMTSIAASVELDVRLKELHECPGTPIVVLTGDMKTSTSMICRHKIGLWEFTRISFRYIFTSVVLATLSIYFALIAGT